MLSKVDEENAHHKRDGVWNCQFQGYQGIAGSKRFGIRTVVCIVRCVNSFFVFEFVF